MAYVLRELGDWDQVQELCDGLLRRGGAPADTLVADGVLGAVHLWRGQIDAARPLLIRCLETASRLDVVSMQCDSAAALAWLAAAEGDFERARELCLLVLERWSRSEDHHYAVWGLRWAAGGSRAPGCSPTRARAPRRCPGSPRRPATRTPWRPSRTRLARPRWRKATPRPPPSSSAARWSFTRTSTSPSNAPRSWCAAGSPAPPRATAKPAHAPRGGAPRGP